MYKIIDPSSFNFDNSVASLVPIHSMGMDSEWMQKRASTDFLSKFAEIKPGDNKSLIHLIAMGASDYYGANRNGDSFYKSSRKLNLPQADWETMKLANGEVVRKGPDTFTDCLDRGLMETYDTFTKSAHVFWDHKNKPHKGDPIRGAVKCAGWNDPMSRVELLIEVDNDEWADELQKISNDEQVPFSMACSVDPNSPVLTSEGYKPISLVEKGDLVYTRKGRWKKVTNTLRNRYNGQTVKIRFFGVNPYDLYLTADHPLMAKKSSPVIQTSTDGYRGEEDGEPVIGWIHAAHLEANDELMIIWPDHSPAKEAIASPYLAGFLGEVFGGVYVENKEDKLAQFFLGEDYCSIPAELFNSSEEVKKTFIGSILDGDNVGIEGANVFVIHSDLYSLMNLQSIVGSLGIPSSVDGVKGRDEEGNLVDIFQLEIPIPFMYFFQGFSALVDSPEFNKIFRDFVSEEQDIECWPNMYMPTTIERVEMQYEHNVVVYNIEVEDDESYVLAGIVSHNCKVPYDVCEVCGHKAKHRGEYCKHASAGLTSILEDGTVVSVANENPHFIDISRVHRPADRIAWSLVKAASSGVLSSAELAETFGMYPDISDYGTRGTERYEILKKLAELEKRVPMLGKKLETGIVGAQFGNESKEKLKNSSGDLQKAAGLFKAFADESVLLPLPHFAALILGDTEKTAELVKRAQPYLPTMFNAILENNSHRVTNNFAYDPAPNRTEESMQKLARSLAADLGIKHDQVRSRVIRQSLNQNTCKVDMEKFSSVRQVLLTPPTEDITGLLSEYGSYKLAFMDNLNQREGLSDFDFGCCVCQNLVQY